MSAIASKSANFPGLLDGAVLAVSLDLDSRREAIASPNVMSRTGPAAIALPLSAVATTSTPRAGSSAPMSGAQLEKLLGRLGKVDELMSRLERVVSGATPVASQRGRK